MRLAGRSTTQAKRSRVAAFYGSMALGRELKPPILSRVRAMLACPPRRWHDGPGAIRYLAVATHRALNFMTIFTLGLNVFLGIVFVGVWGLLSYVASKETEFKPLFFGGLANFVFFIAGYVVTYLSQHSGGSFAENAPAAQGTGSRPAIDIVAVICIALGIIVSIVIVNLCNEGFTASLNKLIAAKAVTFHGEGYNTIQMFGGGMAGTLCVLCLIVYGLYIGSMRHGASYLTALCGVSLSFGVQGLLYVLFGMFFNYQIFQVINVSVPDVLGTYGAVARKLFGIGITSIIVMSCVLFISIVMWTSMEIGGLIAVI
jgi:hypothetical protein